MHPALRLNLFTYLFVALYINLIEFIISPALSEANYTTKDLIAFLLISNTLKLSLIK